MYLREGLPIATLLEATSVFTAVVGRTETHLCAPSDGSSFGAIVHRDVVTSLRALRASASESGFEVALASGFRGFDRQLSIWNRKVSGELPVLASTGQPIDVTTLSERALVFAILRWFTAIALASAASFA